MANLSKRKVQAILARGDKDICFYCECPLFDFYPEMGKIPPPNTRTIEHLEDRHNGTRPGQIENLVLACRSCNNNLGFISLYGTPPTVEQKRQMKGKGAITK